MTKSWVHVEEFTDEVSPAYDLSSWAEWLAETCPDGVDGPSREIKDGEVFKVYITDCEYVHASVEGNEVTFTPDLPDGDTYGIAFGEGLGWGEDDAYYNHKSLIEALVERVNDGDAPEFVIGITNDRKGDYTATFNRTPEGPVLQPDGWAL
ncbi:MAG: hypothetical protein AAGC58_02330 [Asticcacaulis sp.]